MHHGADASKGAPASRGCAVLPGTLPLPRPVMGAEHMAWAVRSLEKEGKDSTALGGAGGPCKPRQRGAACRTAAHA